MPLVTITTFPGKSPETLDSLAGCVRDTASQVFSIPEINFIIKIIDSQVYKQHPDGETDFTTIEVALFSGRSPEVKQTFLHTLVKELEKKLGIQPTQLVVVLKEIPRENWFIPGDAGS